MKNFVQKCRSLVLSKATKNGCFNFQKPAFSGRFVRTVKPAFAMGQRTPKAATPARVLPVLHAHLDLLAVVGSSRLVGRDISVAARILVCQIFMACLALHVQFHLYTKFTLEPMN